MHVVVCPGDSADGHVVCSVCPACQVLALIVMNDEAHGTELKQSQWVALYISLVYFVYLPSYIRVESRQCFSLAADVCKLNWSKSFISSWRDLMRSLTGLTLVHELRLTNPFTHYEFAVAQWQGHSFLLLLLLLLLYSCCCCCCCCSCLFARWIAIFLVENLDFVFSWRIRIHQCAWRI